MTPGGVGLERGRSGPIWGDSYRGAWKTAQWAFVNRRKKAEYKFQLVVNAIFSERRKYGEG
jgi:hypothetical protein